MPATGDETIRTGSEETGGTPVIEVYLEGREGPDANL